VSFEKYRILHQNSKGLAFGFTDKQQFTAKTDQNFIFLRYETIIPDRLDVMAIYIKF
jgi:hypothetical protein